MRYFKCINSDDNFRVYALTEDFAYGRWVGTDHQHYYDTNDKKTDIKQWVAKNSNAREITREEAFLEMV